MSASHARTRRLLAPLLASLIAMSQAGFAQTPAKSAAPATAPQKVQLLFVQNSAGVTMDSIKGTLTLKSVSPSTVFITDRPVRMAGQYHTEQEFLKLWSEGPDSFAKNPPNATLSIVEPGRPDLQNVVLTLRHPRMRGKDLTYDVKVLEGTPPKAAGAAVLFIDILGFWARNIARVAVVGTAAAVTTAAVVSTRAADTAAANTAAANANAAAANANAAAAKAPAPPPPPSSTATQKLEQLKGLQSEGLITEAQYQKASQQVLNEVVK